LCYVLVLFRAAVSATVSLAVLLTAYFVQLLSFYCKFEQIKIDWLIDINTPWSMGFVENLILFQTVQKL